MPRYSKPFLPNSATITTAMTVCIAALAEDKKKAVLVADKMVTTHGALAHGTDDGAEKLVKMAENVYVMYAGGISDATVIIEKARSSIGSKRTAKEIAEHVNQSHLEYLQDMLVRQHLLPRGITSIHEFYHDSTISLDPQIRQQVDVALSTHTLNSNTVFVVCGVEEDGNYRMYFLGLNPRAIPFLVTDGYTAIGSGEAHARFSLIFSDYKVSMTAEEVKEKVLEAKKKAESCLDVGESESVVILG